METTKILTEAQIKAIEQLADALVRVVEFIWDFIKRAVELIKQAFRTIIESYKNKKVLHLAMYHKNPRVRKKNLNRIMKWLRRSLKCRE